MSKRFAIHDSDIGRKCLMELPLDEVDEADEDTLNRILWHSVRGRDDTYPAWAVADDDADDEE